MFCPETGETTAQNGFDLFVSLSLVLPKARYNKYYPLDSIPSKFASSWRTIVSYHVRGGKAHS